MTITVTDGQLSISPAATAETALTLLYLREQIADSETWKALVELPRSPWSDVKTLADAATADRDEALDAIYFDRIDDAGLGQAENEETPFCFIRPWDEWVQSWAATSSWDITGMLLMTFEIPVPTSYRDSIKVATIDFWNKIDTIIQEIQQVGANMTAERLGNPRISRVVLPGEIDPRENNGRRVRRAAFSVETQGVR